MKKLSVLTTSVAVAYGMFFVLTGIVPKNAMAVEDCFDTVSCYFANQECPPCHHGLICGTEFESLGENFVVFANGTEYDEAEMTGTIQECYRSRNCRKTGNECPEDPDQDECAPGLGAWNTICSGSGHLAIGECDD